jgi:small conductance mechanosensitive channel
MKNWRRAVLFWLFLVSALLMPAASSQPADDTPPADSTVVAEDQQLEQRIRNVLLLLEPLSDVTVEVRSGVVLLSGAVSNDTQAERAVNLISQVPGVIVVDDDIQRRLDVQGNLSPMLEQWQENLGQWTRAIPLYLLAVAVFLLIVYAGFSLARWSALWRRLTTNSFLVELIAQTVRTIAILIALVIALNLIGATALVATILGGAGVVGLAVGFAVRDTIENYISSIMLSLRQPFRANDHVLINEHEGRVVRLTSRATVLMTLDGNQLRIPNATVFKAVILNYTRNPERRFSFSLGVDAADDPIAALRVGTDAMRALPFVLADPAPNAIVETVGDSNIVLTFMGWIDQQQTDFGKARSLAIRATMTELEQQGFSLPEPIYRLRMENAGVSGQHSVDIDAAQDEPPSSQRPQTGEVTDLIDVQPDPYLENLVNEERAQKDDSDLLDPDRPVE